MNFMLSTNTADEIGQQVKRCFHRPEITVKALKMLVKYLFFFPGGGGYGFSPIEVLRLRRFPNFPLFYPYAVLMSEEYFYMFPKSKITFHLQNYMFDESR